MIPFATSEQSTLGVEWELALVDKSSGELTSRAQEVLQKIKEKNPDLVQQGRGAHITGEFLDNTLELVTGVCHTVAEALAELAQLRDTLQTITDPLGIGFFSAGTHPFSRWSQQPVANKTRYRRVVERTQYWGRQMVIYGVHVHVGVNSRSKALPILNGLTNYYPHLLALSASSPFWQGEDTGYASHRALMFQQLPTAGLPFNFETWQDYSSYLEDMLATGVIDDPSENRWDIRPVSRYGTVEMRVCDGLPSLAELAAIAAFTQCLVEDLSRQVEAGASIEPLKPWHIQENKWRAARYGLEATIIQNKDNRQVAVSTDISRLVTRLEPIARDLHCSKELAQVQNLLAAGGSYRKQRQLAQEHQGDLTAVVDYLVEQARQSWTG